MRRRGLVAHPGRWLAPALTALALLGATLCPGPARGERKQRGQVIASLGGGISPLRLPRSRPAPVSVHLEGGLRTADGSTLPRLRKVEIDLPDRGVISTRDLPLCSQRRLRNTIGSQALAVCGPALVGRGLLRAEVALPAQAPFTIRAQLLVFNGRLSGGRRALLVHAYATRPPTSVVVPFVLRRRAGGFGTELVAALPPVLGPWPRLADFEMTLGRRYRSHGRRRSFLSATCPIPPRFTAGFLSLARATYTFVGGRRLGVEIVRGCRAR